MNDFDMAVDEFMDDNRINCLEGESGLKNLEQLIQAIGYEPHHFRYGDLIHVFLADNPGAMERIVEFIKETAAPSWQSNLRDVYEDEDELEINS